eukprot:765973-Hanusia_phi.AAC.6
MGPISLGSQHPGVSEAEEEVASSCLAVLVRICLVVRLYPDTREGEEDAATGPCSAVFGSPWADSCCLRHGAIVVPECEDEGLHGKETKGGRRSEEPRREEQEQEKEKEQEQEQEQESKYTSSETSQITCEGLRHLNPTFRSSETDVVTSCPPSCSSCHSACSQASRQLPSPGASSAQE